MTNLEFYKEEIAKEITTQLYSHATSTYECLVACYKKHCDVSSIINHYEILDWLCEEHQILDKEEKEYLSAVIRPFRNKEEVVITIIKVSMSDVENLEINIKREFDFETTLYFPPFEKGTMYKGMKLDKPYTLKDLGL